MLSLIAKYLPKLLPALGTLGKGKATKVGDIIATVSATVAAGHIVTADNVVQLTHEVGFVLSVIFTGVGTIISAFGFGRKAADAARPE